MGTISKNGIHRGRNDMKKKYNLSIWFGAGAGIITIPAVYFNNVYEDDWMRDPLVVEMINTIDKNAVIDMSIMRPQEEKISLCGIISPLDGIRSFKEIAGGTKACILMYKTDRIISASTCGDNCIPIIEKILEYKDVSIQLCHWMEFSEDVYPIRVLNSGEMIDTRNELYREFIRMQDSRTVNVDCIFETFL